MGCGGCGPRSARSTTATPSRCPGPSNGPAGRRLLLGLSTTVHPLYAGLRRTGLQPVARADGIHTAGTAFLIADGAAAMMVMSAQKGPSSASGPGPGAADLSRWLRPCPHARRSDSRRQEGAWRGRGRSGPTWPRSIPTGERSPSAIPSGAPAASSPPRRCTSSSGRTRTSA